jgi:phosphate transport system substrate-binding protein
MKLLNWVLFVMSLQAARAHTALVVKLDGSSTVFPISEAAGEEFQKAKKGAVNVTIGISGTGGGFKKFCRGETDIQDASRPIMKDEIEICSKAGIEYFELPIAFDAITLAVSTKNTWLKSMSVDELKTIWEPTAQTKIIKWKQVRADWPDEAIRLFGAGSDSGTFDYFTEAIVGKAKSSRGDYTASEDDNTLVQGISGDKAAIGYIPFSYYEANQKRLRAVAIVGGPKAPKKEAVLPTQQTVESGTYYPLSRPIFIYVNAKSYEKPEVKDFVAFYLKNAATLVRQVKYISLPIKAYEYNEARLRKNIKGSMFQGDAKIGMRIDELLKRESKL